MRFTIFHKIPHIGRHKIGCSQHKLFYLTPKRYEIVCLPNKKFRLISVCSLFQDTKLDQTDTSSDNTISFADQSGDDGNETTASEKSSKKKKGKQGKKVHVLEGSTVGYSGRFFLYTPSSLII